MVIRWVDWNNSVGVLEVKLCEKSPLTQAANNFNCIVDRCIRSIPSLTLMPGGHYRSTIIRHLPGWQALGIWPMGLVWIPSDATGPTKWPNDTLCAMYWATISLLQSEEGWLHATDRRLHLAGSKPIGNPSSKPLNSHDTKHLSGWWHCNDARWLWLIGVGALAQLGLTSGRKLQVSRDQMCRGTFPHCPC